MLLSPAFARGGHHASRYVHVHHSARHSSRTDDVRPHIPVDPFDYGTPIRYPCWDGTRVVEDYSTAYAWRDRSLDDVCVTIVMEFRDGL